MAHALQPPDVQLIGKADITGAANWERVRAGIADSIEQLVINDTGHLDLSKGVLGVLLSAWTGLAT